MLPHLKSYFTLLSFKSSLSLFKKKREREKGESVKSLDAISTSRNEKYFLVGEMTKLSTAATSLCHLTGPLPCQTKQPTDFFYTSVCACAYFVHIHMFIYLRNILHAYIPLSHFLLLSLSPCIPARSHREEDGVEDDTRASLAWASCGALSFRG